MAWGFLALLICALVPARGVRAHVLVELDSFLSARAQHAISNFIRRADSVNKPIEKIYQAFCSAAFPIQKIVRIQRVGGDNVYRIVCQPPACLLRTSAGVFATPLQSSSWCTASFFDQDYVRGLMSCAMSAEKVGRGLAWLRKQDPALLDSVLVSWRDEHTIYLEVKNAEPGPRFLITQEQNLDATLSLRMNDLISACTKTKRGDVPVFDLRYDGMVVQRNAQKNRKGGGR